MYLTCQIHLPKIDGMHIDPPDQIVIYLIENAIKSYRRFAQKNIRKVHGEITVDQVLLLILLKTNPDISQVQLGEILFKDYGSVTRMINLMVAKKYLIREDHQKDGRRKELFLSEKGEQTIDLLIPVILQNRQTALKGLDEEELAQLSFLLKKIITNCKNP